MQYFRETKRHGLDLGSVLFFVEKSDFLVSVTFNKKRDERVFHDTYCVLQMGLWSCGLGNSHTW